MNENITKIMNQMNATLNSLNKRTKIIIGAAVAGVIAISAVVAILLNNTPYEMLFGELTQEEASQIMAKLDEQGVSYKYENSAIYVPRDEESMLKATFVSEGYPKTGSTYDVFTNNIDMMSTDFEKQSYLLFDLQARMEEDIRSFKGVVDATVYIALPEDSKYVLSSDTEERSSASVKVVMENGETPTKEQAQGIQTLVSGGVPGMLPEDVKVVDGNGVEVLAVDTEQDTITMARVKLDIQEEIENSIKSKVIYMLADVYGGTDKIRVSVNAVMDLDKKISEIINYYPEGDTNAGVLAHEQTGLEYATSGELTEGIPGADTNADIPVYPGINVVGDEIFISDQKSADYLVSQVKEQIQSDFGEITDLSVSVVISEDNIGDTERENLINLVANTAGIPLVEAPEKVTIVNQMFAGEETSEDGNVEVLPESILSLPLWVFIAIGGGVLLLIILIIIIAKARKRKKRKKAEALAAQGLAPDGTPLQTGETDEYLEQLESLTNLPETRGDKLKTQISDLATTNPEIVAGMIKVLLRGEEMVHEAEE